MTDEMMVYAEWESLVTDLNGDGDMLDYVLQVVDFPSLQVTNTGLAVLESDDGYDWWGPHLDGARFLFTVSEPAQGVDLNGDGDATDPAVAHIYQLGEPGVNLQLASNHDRAVLLGAGVAVAVSEALQGGDLDGDGVSGSFISVVPYTSSSWKMVGPLVAVATELPRNQNRSMLFLTDPRSGTVLDTRLPVTLIGEQLDGRAGVEVSEADWDDGPRDLDGDGDTDDSIAGVLSAGRR